MQSLSMVKKKCCLFVSSDKEDKSLLFLSTWLHGPRGPAAGCGGNSVLEVRV